jgi:glucose/arabinose dehydrogenase
MRRPLLVLLATAALAAAWASAPAAAFDLVQLPGTYSQPVQVTGPPGDGSQVLVVERFGRIMEVGSPTPFLDLTGQVDTNSEEGLLSMAFARDYATSGRYWILYNADLPDTPSGSDPAGSDIVVEERLRDDPGHAAEIIRIPHPEFGNHNGGQIQLGPDDNLWISTGDGGGGNDQLRHAQRPDSLLGKLLRITPRPGGGHDIPPGNPFEHGGGAPQVWALGLRNPWRWSFDRVTGDLLLGDVGQGLMEEIDRAPAPGLGCGANYGWSAMEGTEPMPFATLSSPHTPPLIVHRRADTPSWKAIAGGFVIRDPALGADVGKYVYGDFYVNELWLANPQTGATAPTDELVSSLSGWGEDGLGRVYAVSLNNGAAYRLVPEGGGANGDAGPPVEFTPPGCAAAPRDDGDGSGDGSGPEFSFDPPATGFGPFTIEPPPAPQARPALRLTAGTAPRQRAARTGRIFLRAGCDAPCVVTARGTLRVGARRFGLGIAAADLRAAGLATLRLNVSRAARRAARRALRRRAQPRATLTVGAVGLGATPPDQVLTVAVRR